ncbi:hypothetical protein EVAR_72356_1, partial [Eumeta japonica]
MQWCIVDIAGDHGMPTNAIVKTIALLYTANSKELQTASSSLYPPNQKLK